jgi:hypothetical protein
VDQNRGMTARTFFSVMRYRSDPIRDEYRNVAILLADEAGKLRALRAIRPGNISRSVEEHGVLATLIESIERGISSGAGLELRRLADSYSHSVVFSDPQPALTRGDFDSLLDSLFRTLVAPKPIRHAAGYTKGHLIDRLSRWVKGRGASFEIGTYFGGYAVDAVLRTPPEEPVALQITSFATRQLNARTVEQEIGHFLYAASHMAGRCVGVVQPPAPGALVETQQLQQRVMSWFDEAGVEALTPTEFKDRMDVTPRPVAESFRQLAMGTLAS